MTSLTHRRLVRLLVAGVVAALLAACGSPSPSPSGGGAGTGPRTATAGQPTHTSGG